MKKMLLLFAIATFAFAGTINVPGTYGPTIQAAINAANSGDVINVAAGTYTEQLTVSINLTINGNNVGISAGATPGVRNTETIVKGGFYLHASSSIIDGFTIQTGYNNGSHKTGVVVGATNIEIKNNIITGCGILPIPVAQSNGIETVGGSNNLLVKDNEIFNNWRGIYLNPSDGVTIDGNSIHANNNGPAAGTGIGSDGQTNLTITGNNIYDHIFEGWGSSNVGVNVVAEDNTFNNSGVDVAHYGEATIDATCNWWGSVDGPSDGAISGDVTFSPWLVALDGPCAGGTPFVVKSAVHEHLATLLPSRTRKLLKSLRKRLSI